MASQNPLETQETAFPHSVFFNRLISIFAARGEETAALIGFQKRKETMIER